MMLFQLGERRVFDGDVERGYTGATELTAAPTGEPILIDRSGELLPPAQRKTAGGTITLNVPVPDGGGVIPPATAPTQAQPQKPRVVEPEQDAPDLAIGKRPMLAAAPTRSTAPALLLWVLAAAALYFIVGDDE